MASLYEIETRIADAIESGDCTNEELDALEMEEGEKLENIIKFVKSLDADIKALKEEEERLKAKRKAAEAKKLRLRDYIGYCLHCEKRKIGHWSVWFKPTTEVVADDGFKRWALSNGRAELLVERVSYDINNDAVKAAINENGELLEGVKLVGHFGTMIR